MFPTDVDYQGFDPGDFSKAPGSMVDEFGVRKQQLVTFRVSEKLLFPIVCIQNKNATLRINTIFLVPVLVASSKMSYIVLTPF